MSSFGRQHPGANPFIPTKPATPAPSRRQATVYDAVAGRVSSTGFIPRRPFTSKNRDTLSSTSVAVPPEKALFRRRGAPERFAEDDIYWASRHLREDQVLPDSDLLKAVHAYASEFYGRRGGGADFVSLDGTALIAVGVLLEEWAGEAAGAGGEGAFVEGDEGGEKKSGEGEAGGSMRARAWRGRRMAEKRSEGKKRKKREEAEKREDEDEGEVVIGKTTDIPNGEQPRILRSQLQGKNNKHSNQNRSDDESTTDSTTTNSDSHEGIVSDDDDDDDDADSDQENDSTEGDSTEDSDQEEHNSTEETPHRNLNSISSLSSPSASASASASAFPEDEDEDENEDEETNTHKRKRRKTETAIERW